MSRQKHPVAVAHRKDNLYSELLDDSELNKLLKASNSHLLRHSCEEIVSKVIAMRMVDSNDYPNSCVVVSVVATKHLPRVGEEMDGKPVDCHSLLVTQVKKTVKDSVSNDVCIEMSHLSSVRIADLHSHKALPQQANNPFSSQIVFEIVHVSSQPLLVLFSCGCITLHALSSTRTVLFRIEPLIVSPLQVNIHINLSIALGKLLILFSSNNKEGVTESQIHTVSLIDLIKHPLLCQAEGILHDITAGSLLVHNMVASERNHFCKGLRKLSNCTEDEQENEAGGSAGDRSKSVGTFIAIQLPPKLQTEVIKFYLAAGRTGPLQTGSAGNRLIQSGVLVADSSKQATYNTSIFLSNTDSNYNDSMRGVGLAYLAVTVGSIMVPRQLKVRTDDGGSSRMGASVDNTGSNESIFLWVYNKLTKRWRNTFMEVDPSSKHVEICEVILNDDADADDRANSTDTVLMKVKEDVAPTGAASVDVVSTPVKVRPHSAVHYIPVTPIVIPQIDSDFILPQSLALSHGSGIISGPLLAATSIAWFCEHTIVLISKRKGSRYCLEVLSREVSKASLASGKPSPAMHKIIPFPPGWCPKHFDLRSYNTNSDTDSSCYISVGTSNHFVMFHVKAVLKPNATGSPRGPSSSTATVVQDYVIFKLWEVNVSTACAVSEGSHVPIQLPVKKTLVSISNISSNNTKFVPFPVLFVLDNEGKVFSVNGKVTEMNTASQCDLVSGKNRYFDIAIVTDAFAHSFPRHTASLPAPASTASVRIAEVVMMQSRHSYESNLLLRLDNFGLSHSANDGNTLISKTLVLPLPSIPVDAIPFGFTSGIRLSIRYNDTKPACIIYGAHDDNAHKFTVLADVLQHWQLSPPLGNLGNLIVEQDSITSILFSELSKCPTFETVAHSLVPDIIPQCDAQISSGDITDLMTQVSKAVYRSPRATCLFVETLERTLKYLIENMFNRRLIGATNDFLVLTSSTMDANPILLIELVSCLSRKLDPALCKRLFPALPAFVSKAAIADPSRFRVSSSALSMYELCLTRNYLAHAARMLTVASDHVGGIETSPTKTLRMVVELLYKSLQLGSLNLMVQCLDFSLRLEKMAVIDGLNDDKEGVPAHSTELQTTYNRGGWRLGEKVYGSLASVSPALSYIGGGALWALTQAIEILSLPTPEAPAARATHQRHESSLSSYQYSTFAIIEKSIGPDRWQKMWKTPVSTKGESIPIHFISIFCQNLLRSQRYCYCACVLMSLCTSNGATEALFAHILEELSSITTADSMVGPDEGVAVDVCNEFNLAKLVISSESLQKRTNLPLYGSYLRRKCQVETRNNGDSTVDPDIVQAAATLSHFDIPCSLFVSPMQSEHQTDGNNLYTLLFSLAVSCLLTRRYALFAYLLCIFNMPTFGSVLLVLLYSAQPGDRNSQQVIDIITSFIAVTQRSICAGNTEGVVAAIFHSDAYQQIPCFCSDPSQAALAAQIALLWSNEGNEKGRSIGKALDSTIALLNSRYKAPSE